MSSSGFNHRQPISSTRPTASVEELIDSPFAEDLIAAAGHGSLNEDLALTMLRRRDLPAAAIEALTRNHAVMKDRRVLVDLAQHQRTPRHLSLPLMRRLFPFELMQIALAPAVAADLKIVAEEALIGKLETLSLGERISLARRASSRVAAALLLDSERAVTEAALQNASMTEAWIVKALMKPEVRVLFIDAVTRHAKWSLRREIQIAILRRPEATSDHVTLVGSKLPPAAVRELLRQTRLPQATEHYLKSLIPGLESS